VIADSRRCDSLQPQRAHRVDFGGSSGRSPGGDYRQCAKQEGHADEGQRICRTRFEKETPQDVLPAVSAYQSENRGKRAESERFKAFAYDELLKRDKLSLDLIWLRDESLEDSENLPAPEVIAAEIVEDLQAALDQFAAIAASLGGTSVQAELGLAASRQVCSHQVTAAR